LSLVGQERRQYEIDSEVRKGNYFKVGCMAEGGCSVRELIRESFLGKGGGEGTYEKRELLHLVLWGKEEVGLKGISGRTTTKKTD